MTVRVANDFKTEAQHELEKLVLENKTLRDKNRSLESQVEKLKGMLLVPYDRVALLRDNFYLAYKTPLYLRNEMIELHIF